MPEHPTILVTGGAGFIGSHIVEYYQNRAAEIRVLDNLRSGSLANLTGLKHRFLQGSVTNREAVRSAVDGVDYVFHLAAFISVPESMNDPLLCEEINVAGTLTVLEEASRAGVKKLVFSSSAAVYGDDPPTPTKECQPPAPQSPYAITKLSGEYYGALFQREGRLQCTTLRYFNVFGPRQNPGSAYATAVPVFLDRAIRGEPLVIYGDGQQTRDFVNVRDVAAANAFAAENAAAASPVYNVGYGAKLAIRDLAQQIIQAADSSSEILYEEARPGDVRHSQASVERLQGTGFLPETNLSEGLEETLTYCRRQAIIMKD